MRLQYDKTADALYIYFQKGKIFSTKKLTSSLIVDIGRGGKIVGLEVLDASLRMGFKKNKRAGVEIPIAITA